jgi:hypothetical protein
MQLFTVQRAFVLLSLLALIGGCGGAQSQAHGSATYAAPVSQGGQALQQSSQVELSISITGSGSFQAVQNAVCTLTSGDLSETTSANGQVGSGGAYQGSFDVRQSSSAWTNSLCGTVQNAKLNSLTTFTLKATVPANSANCQSYCSATAAVQCQGSTDPNCSANASATCTTQCTSSQKIVAHGSLQQTDMAAANQQLSSSGEVTAQVDLVFNAVE